MHTRLYTFLEKCDIHSLQFGFLSKHSTLHALISLTESVKKTIDDGMVGCGVFIDLQKRHSILLTTQIFFIKWSTLVLGVLH